ncbi:hypothetical protein [Rubrobacter xylanophilus]|uniref:hypothetical protein n=1 Tax=Rubrobacter xylanophilus TaxID=49319 RepID=UPI001C63E77C|nr:hypothetical protein [Rubrobacter xylanophilus]
MPVRPAEVLATGLAGAVAAFVTSRFGIAGTVLGTAVAVMIITAASSVIQAYLEGAAGRLFVLPRRRILLGAAATAALSLTVGLAMVTGVELGAGKSLSCWLWDRCLAGERHGDGTTAHGTRPSLLGGEPVGIAVSQASPQGAGEVGAPRQVPENRSFYRPQTPQRAPASAPGTREVRPTPAAEQSGALRVGDSQTEEETPEVRPVMPETPAPERPEETPMPEVPLPGEGGFISAPED